MSHVEQLESARKNAAAAIESASTSDELDAAESRLLGKDSVIGEVRRAMGSLEPGERPAVGAALQAATREIEGMVSARREVVDAGEEAERLSGDSIDVTLEAISFPRGSMHLIQQTINDISDIFVGLGYQVADGPEAELGWYNFDALNTPVTHPSRLDPTDEVLLRTHTSPVQVRWMQEHQPPVYIVVPGKVYRTDTIDASHLPVFHQIEGLVVDEGITFSDLKGTLAHFAREYFGPETEVRLRPHFFPFTEPSAELDVSCFNCDGGEADCRVCKGAGWLEMLGCGMVDPNVLEAVGYDPTKVSGFAFGMGVERPAMARYGINDIRMFIDNDLRFLRQF
jgi:phenylalanyl-tRNA synthetase alpha chain